MSEALSTSVGTDFVQLFHLKLSLLSPQVLTGWHYAVKLGMAMDLWTSNRLRLAFSQWAQVGLFTCLNDASDCSATFKML